MPGNCYNRLPTNSIPSAPPTIEQIWWYVQVSSGVAFCLRMIRTGSSPLCMVITYSRVWINRVRLPILLVVSWTGKMNIPLSPCVPENLVSRDGFSRPVPRQPAYLHTQAESGAYLRDCSRVPRRRPYETAIRHRVSPEFIGSRNCVPMAFTAESPTAQGQ